jgi:hypothetical protein
MQIQCIPVVRDAAAKLELRDGVWYRDLSAQVPGTRHAERLAPCSGAADLGVKDSCVDRRAGVN